MSGIAGRPGEKLMAHTPLNLLSDDSGRSEMGGALTMMLAFFKSCKVGGNTGPDYVLRVQSNGSSPQQCRSKFMSIKK